MPKIVGEIDKLATEAFSYLKEIEYWTGRYNEIVSLLRSAGYYQVGEILHNCSWQPQIKAFLYSVVMQHEAGGTGFMSAESFLSDVAEGPLPQSIHYKEELPRQISTKIKSTKRSALLALLGDEASWICVYCQSSGDHDSGPDNRPWHIDHLFAQANGGDSIQDNLILSCATCNIRKNKKLASEILAAIKTKMEAR